jgi:hypothetical protein
VRKSLRVLIERLVAVRNSFDAEKERAKTAVMELARARASLGRMKEEIDDLMESIDAVEKLS